VDEDGTPFGRYRLISLIGRGGMGEVWRAHDTGTDRIVAIKLLPANFSENEEFKQRFRREAHAAARLNTPHVIPIYDYGEIDGRLYVCMRLIDGRDLQAVLADGPIEPSRAVRIIEQVALALHAAHKVGLLHRDVKPSNILLDENDFAYLIDFGIARAADETRLTKTGNTIGTFQYIAPERLGTRAEEDARADIYSLACVLYECLTGHPPFDEATMAQLVAAHLNTPPPQPSTTQPKVPPQIDQVIATGMAKDPDQRYATTVELATAAHDAITTPIPRPSAVPPQPAKTTEPESASTADIGATVVEPENRVDQGASATSRPRAQVQPTDPTMVADRTLSAPQTIKPAPSTNPSVAASMHADSTNQPPTQLAPSGPTRPPHTAEVPGRSVDDSSSPSSQTVAARQPASRVLDRRQWVCVLAGAALLTTAMVDCLIPWRGVSRGWLVVPVIVFAIAGVALLAVGVRAAGDHRRRPAVLAGVVLLSIAAATEVFRHLAGGLRPRDYDFWAQMDVWVAVVLAILGLGLLIVPQWRRPPSPRTTWWMIGAGAVLVVAAVVVLTGIPMHSFWGALNSSDSSDIYNYYFPFTEYCTETGSAFGVVHDSFHDWVIAYGCWDPARHVMELQAAPAGTGLALVIGGGAIQWRARRRAAKAG
jgi:serine/threonine-protein kinase